MVPEQYYQEHEGVTDPFVIIAIRKLQKKYDDKRRARIRAMECCIALGINPRTGRHSVRKGAKRVTASCRPMQPQKRARNSFSKEEAGTIVNTISVKRFDNSYITKVSYRKNLW